MDRHIPHFTHLLHFRQGQYWMNLHKIYIHYIITVSISLKNDFKSDLEEAKNFDNMSDERKTICWTNKDICRTNTFKQWDRHPFMGLFQGTMCFLHHMRSKVRYMASMNSNHMILQWGSLGVFIKENWIVFFICVGRTIGQTPQITSSSLKNIIYVISLR